VGANNKDVAFGPGPSFKNQKYVLDEPLWSIDNLEKSTEEGNLFGLLTKKKGD